MGFGVDVSVDSAVGEGFGWLVGDILVGILVTVAIMGVSDGLLLFDCPGMKEYFISRLIPYASPLRMIRLIITSSSTPVGVMRIVHPTLRR